MRYVEVSGARHDPIHWRFQWADGIVYLAGKRSNQCFHHRPDGAVLSVAINFIQTLRSQRAMDRTRKEIGPHRYRFADGK